MPEQIEAGDLVVAVLYRAQMPEFFQDQDLVSLFGQTAEDWGGVWRQFRQHPAYRDCQELQATLSTLQISGLVGWKQYPSGRSKIFQPLRGPYGRNKYMSLPESVRCQVDKLAERLKGKVACR